MKQEETNRKSEEDHIDKYANADYSTIRNIKLNYERMEQGIVNELYFKVPHGSTIGHYREQIWGKMFRNIVPKKFVIEQSMFIIDSYGQVSKEVDLAVFDETYTPYIFSYGNLKFLPIEAVAAVIECKSSSMDKKILKKWACSIKALRTSNKSYIRMIGKIVCGEIEPTITQTATRPLRILCCLNEKDISELVDEDENPFDIVIRAIPNKGGKLQIEWDDSKKNLYDWYVSLNHAKGLPEHKNDQVDWEEAVKNYGLDKYLVHHEGTELSLLTFNFQLNQVLMLINNPMLFPHAAYAEMFDNNGNMEEKGNEQIVALSVDKIQTFLTEVIHSHAQEKQTEDATLRGIINSSYQVSKGFFEHIHNKFPEFDNYVLLKCSGVYVFRCTLSEAELESRLNTLFEEYYRESQGQKLIRWTVFSSEGLDDIAAIQTAKANLKKTNNWNEIISKNRELLFSFCKAPEDEDKKRSIKIDTEKFPAFAENINALRKKENNEEANKKEDDSKRFRIAILKADLDRMGAMFKNIKDYKKYRNISQILNEEISLEGLHRMAVKCAPEGRRGWLFPLYIAGDDIFFAVAIEDLICGINVCREIMQNVNGKIKECGNTTKLFISVGVEITFNKQPVRYYMEMVEAQLKNAKSKKISDTLNEFFIMKISIGNMTFFDIDYGELKKEKELLECKTKEKSRCKCENCRKRSAINQQLKNTPIWNFFLSDVKLLNYIRSKESGCSEFLGKPNFFYTLLEDITADDIQSDQVQYINHILYHLRPRHLDDSDQRAGKLELLLNGNLIRQLYIKDEYGTRIKLDSLTRHRFESYLRLMLLFCDARFQISDKEGWDMYEKRFEESKTDICRYLFVQPRKYLFERCLKKLNRELTAVFVKEKTLKKSRKCGYQRLVLETSMLYRLRETDTIPVEKAADMIELRNPSTVEAKQEIQALNEKREKEGKHPNRLYFDKEKFCKLAVSTKAWTPVFVDSLMLFYQYNELAMKFKKTELE